MNRKEFLSEVGRIVGSDRQAQHGNPEDNFVPIAAMWKVYLKQRHGVDVALDSKDVAWMMVLLKVVRAAGNPSNMDNLLDAAGYVACIAPSISDKRPVFKEDNIASVMEEVMKSKITAQPTPVWPQYDYRHSITGPRLEVAHNAPISVLDEVGAILAYEQPKTN
jgi:hypothetical protein